MVHDSDGDNCLECRYRYSEKMPPTRQKKAKQAIKTPACEPKIGGIEVLKAPSAFLSKSMGGGAVLTDCQ